MDLARELGTIAAEQRQIAARLEVLIAHLGSANEPIFDPTDRPPVHPSHDGDRIQRDWCALTLWARLFALNVRANRGATKEEAVQIAKDAGYADGRGWNRWTGWNEREDGRWVTTTGIGHLKHYYRQVGRSLPSDLAEAAEQLSTECP